MRRLFSFLALLLLPCLALGDSLPLEGAAPYPPVVSAYEDDNWSYDDGTVNVRVRGDEAHDTKIYYVYVTTRV